MNSTYSITEAQTNLPRLVREAEDHPVVITRRDKVVAYVLSPERMAAILETMELLGTPRAMKAVADARAGRTKYHPLAALDSL